MQCARVTLGASVFIQGVSMRASNVANSHSPLGKKQHQEPESGNHRPDADKPVDKMESSQEP
jgi:hypothetical protein